MDNTYHTTESTKNKHLTAFERGQIKLLLDEGYTRYAIAKRLSRTFNTIKNEIKRGSVMQLKKGKYVEVYFPETGQKTYDTNRLNSRRKYKFIECDEFIDHVLDLFKNSVHSLDAICGAAKLHGLFTDDKMVCTKTLYNYVDLGLIGIKNLELPLKVRRSTKVTRARKHKKTLGASIEERPEDVLTREEFGHWEIDTVIGEKSNNDEVLVTIVERKTRMDIVRKVSGKTADAVQKVMEEIRSEIGEKRFNQIFKSITADNGGEFARLSELEAVVDTKIYFAHPYASWERGTNERHNGLIRRFIPKGKRLADVSVEKIAMIQNWCNTLPRKILGYLTPEEAFQTELNKLV